jgi:hypothetical protein
MLISFLKSKDDNMLLLTSNLLIELVLFIDFDKEFFDDLLEKTFSLIEHDPSFRLITCSKLSKVFYLTF